MNSLKKLVKSIFYKHYHITPSSEQTLLYECDGRIIRSLKEETKKYCAAYVLQNLE